MSIQLPLHSLECKLTVTHTNRFHKHGSTMLKILKRYIALLIDNKQKIVYLKIRILLLDIIMTAGVFFFINFQKGSFRCHL